jgi:hypothetical protein
MGENYIHVLAPYTLDGAGACAVINWYLSSKNYNLKFTPCTKSTIIAEYNNLINRQDIKKIYIIGGYLLGNNTLKQDPSVTIFSLNKDLESGQQVKVIDGDFKNYTQFLYSSFKEKIGKELDKPKNLLLDLIQDYTTYNLTYGDLSIGLNTIFSSIPGKDKLEIFLQKFQDGFVSFSNEDKNIINQHNNIKNNILDGDKFIGSVPINGKEIKIVSVFGEGCMLGCVNEVAQKLISDLKADIAIVVNPSLNFVSFRKSLNCDVNLKSLAQKLCDGDGKDYAASGKITENFLKFTKLLKK